MEFIFILIGIFVVVILILKNRSTKKTNTKTKTNEPSKIWYCNSNGVSRLVIEEPEDLSEFKKNVSGPSEVFSMLGPTMKELWDELVEGKNHAVEIFNNYLRYERQLRKEYSEIDFKRILTINKNERTFPISAGEAMYLKLLNIKNDIYITSDDEKNPIVLTFSEYEYILGMLNDEENSYCQKIKKYINENIKILVEDASRNLYGINLCNSTLPFNTLECRNYDMHVCTGDYYFLYKDIKWNRVINSPIFNYKTSQNNPLIIKNINCIATLIMDYLCYATIAVPSDNIDKVLHYKDKNSGTTVLQAMINTYGNVIAQYIEQTIAGMNCWSFRHSLMNEKTTTNKNHHSENDESESYAPFPSLKAKNNGYRLLNTCIELTREYEKSEPNNSPSCENDLEECLLKRIEAAKDELDEWEDDDTDYVRIAHTLLANTTYDMLTSGEYTLTVGFGMIDPNKCGPNLLNVYKRALEYGVTNGMLTDEEKEIEYKNLLQKITGI